MRGSNQQFSAAAVHACSLIASLESLTSQILCPQAAASRELKASVVSCPAMKCPSGFIAQKACDTSCGYECYTQAKLNWCVI